MKYVRFFATTAAAGGMVLASAGVALASDVSMTGTGPGSNQLVTVEQLSETSTTNTNIITVTNQSAQQSQTGDVTVTGNTTAGGSTSGEAANSNTTSTTVVVGNPPVGGLGGDQPGDVTTPSDNNETVTMPAANMPAGGRGGNVLGAATMGGLGGGTVLPEVGASEPVDVSALRAAWQPPSSATADRLANRSQGISALMLSLAALLSLGGAVGSAIYSRRQERKAA